MNSLPIQHSRRSAFTLVEIMVVVSLLSLMVYGLYTMFNQTQRYLRSNDSQVNILESGRAAMDVIGRELEQVYYSGLLDPRYFMPHLITKVDYTNFLRQPLVDGTIRINQLQECFYLTRPNNRWVANGFFVASTVPTASGTGTAFTTNLVNQIGVGTLYRYTSPITPAIDGKVYLNPWDVTNWISQFTLARSSIYMADMTNSAINPSYPLTEGVVHFRVRSLDRFGQSISITNAIRPPYSRLLPDYGYLTLGNEQSYYSYKDLPAYLDVELGIIDPQVMQKVRAFTSPIAQRNFLTNQVNAVHLFHRLIPLRNAQPWPPL